MTSTSFPNPLHQGWHHFQTALWSDALTIAHPLAPSGFTTLFMSSKPSNLSDSKNFQHIEQKRRPLSYVLLDREIANVLNKFASINKNNYYTTFLIIKMLLNQNDVDKQVSFMKAIFCLGLGQGRYRNE